MIDSRLLRQAFGQFATGVTVITARDGDGRPVGVTASSFNTVSLSPPLVLWSLDRRALSFGAFAEARHFAVHVLAAHQRTLSDRFARAATDKFAALALDGGIGGVPLIAGVDTVFECETEHRYEGGDHLILVGRVLRLSLPAAPPEPLLFCHGRYASVAAEPGIA
ncbi:flavin reductase family protein [Pseudothauera rhizosphaerae]|uniref:Flavin reductase family protein n=1 Tax=Pseudothauera rhizosphaerae TaxID=2565932 RepID=A0A4S4AS01_9RHOO|nr:flavin reductase family protein [Pseudothauera rhizosphaerae]THF62163.1 flavin reductase family protein [Pseudothauera rhizosphaerae]